MSKEAEVTMADEWPALRSVETRDTLPTTGDSNSTSEEVWTLVEVQDSTNMNTNGSSNNTMNQDMSFEGEAEYTAVTPGDLQDSTVQGSSSTSTMSTEGEAEYTASTSEASPRQYSPREFIHAKERSREVVGSSIDFPYDTAEVIIDPPPKESILPGIRGT